MLQAAEEDANGVVSWRDVRCSEGDDVKALWTLGWEVTDFMSEDKALALPAAAPTRPPTKVPDLVLPSIATFFTETTSP